MNLINTFLATGREIRSLELLLCGIDPRDPDRAELGRRHTALMRRQQDEMVAAVQAGSSWETVTFCLALHGQGADRDVCSDGPTPAEILGEAMRRLGPEQFIARLDAAKQEAAEQATA